MPEQSGDGVTLQRSDTGGKVPKFRSLGFAERPATHGPLTQVTQALSGCLKTTTPLVHATF